ncbi:phosphoribosyl pyrophosphate (PRPP) synthase 3 [Actinidia rufa]|uniref:Phosphoribosyl pyrophosphate (PRPP) synthase 3 n=1 Tax=Actinidia rufa TaxID=165716 RepID=A0A7J0HDU1_9ERIC|nr:phosphoribosyl pyrophosphate (PRPP) synthase 3 [Actinidia rufa]
MSTTRPPLPSPSTNPSKILNPIVLSSLLPQPHRPLRSFAKNFHIRCELRSFELRGASTTLRIGLFGFEFEEREEGVPVSLRGDEVSLAERIAAESDAIELRSITWRTFEDGFPNLFISNAQGIRGQHVAFLASFSSPGVIFEQLSVIYALPKLFVSSFTVVLPFFPTGTFERMEEEGDVATAFTLARILSNIPISRGGPTSLVIFDIHALQERFYFGDNVLPCFESGIPLLKNRLQQLPDSDNIVCAKVREGDQRIVRIKEGDPRGRHVVIVDDLVQSGGTLIECQKVLAKHGAAKISAYVTHGIFPKRSWERFDHDNGGRPENGFTYFWITDSCPTTVKEVKNRLPFEVLSLASSIAASLQI